ncbi:hypothetical protein OIV83_006521, partial [Microbotryomycetes sp. JL201]
GSVEVQARPSAVAGFTLYEGSETDINASRLKIIDNMNCLPALSLLCPEATAEIVNPDLIFSSVKSPEDNMQKLQSWFALDRALSHSQFLAAYSSLLLIAEDFVADQQLMKDLTAHFWQLSHRMTDTSFPALQEYDRVCPKTVKEFDEKLFKQVQRNVFGVVDKNVQDDYKTGDYNTSTLVVAIKAPNQ